MNKQKYSVVIPTMNRYLSLKETINSFLSIDILPDEIIIIDQSTDSSVSELILSFISDKQKKYSVVFNYFFQSVGSLTIARNKGLALSKNEIVVFSDDDVEVNQNAINSVLEFFEEKSVSLIAGINELEKKSHSLLGYLLGYKSILKRRTGHVAAGIFGRFPNKIKEQTPTMWAMGFFFAIRKPLVEKWNLKWDEKLIGYGYPEDLDFSYAYCRRSKIAGFKCIMSNRVVVKHLNSQEYRIPSRHSTFMLILHRAYLYKKHHFAFYYWIMFNIANFAMLMKRKIKKERPQDLQDAIRYLRKHKKEVFNGDFYYGD